MDAGRDHSFTNWIKDLSQGPNGRLLPVPESEARHFSVRQQQTAQDADTALAISLQDAEVAQQQAHRMRPRMGPIIGVDL